MPIHPSSFFGGSYYGGAVASRRNVKTRPDYEHLMRIPGQEIGERKTAARAAAVAKKRRVGLPEEALFEDDVEMMGGPMYAAPTPRYPQRTTFDDSGAVQSSTRRDPSLRGPRGRELTPKQLAVRKAIAADRHWLHKQPGFKAWQSFRAAGKAAGKPYRQVLDEWRASKGKGPKHARRTPAAVEKRRARLMRLHPTNSVFDVPKSRKKYMEETGHRYGSIWKDAQGRFHGSGMRGGAFPFKKILQDYYGYTAGYGPAFQTEQHIREEAEKFRLQGNKTLARALHEFANIKYLKRPMDGTGW
jgi:hypothetical protein